MFEAFETDDFNLKEESRSGRSCLTNDDIVSHYSEMESANYDYAGNYNAYNAL